MPAVNEVRGSQVDDLSRDVARAREPSRVVAVRRLTPIPPMRPLFSDSLLDTSAPERKRRGLAAVLSFTFEVLFIGAVLIFPLIYTDALPKQQLLTFLVAPPPPPPPTPAAAVVSKAMRKVQTNLLTGGQLRAPTRIPERVQMIHEEEVPPDVSGVMGGVPGGVPGGQLGGVIGGIVNRTSNLAAVPKLALPIAPTRIRISQGVTKGQLIYRVEPEYPKIALSARIQGQVLLKAIIAKDGTIKELELVSGHPMLTQNAIQGVRQWRYRPFLLNGEPVEVETNVAVIFQIPQ